MNANWSHGARTLAVVALASVVGSIQAAPLSGQGTWEQTLQGRDLDGNADNGFEAYYDTTQNLTWLADANFAATKGLSTSGLVAGYNPVFGAAGAPGTAAGLAFAANVHGIDDWQLPSLVLGREIYGEVCQPGRTTCDVIPTGRYNVIPGSSQLQNLMELTLGNRSSGNGIYTLDNTGPFKNLQTGLYWSSEFMATSRSYSGWTYDTATGQHVQQPHFNNGHAWLVRKGDVAAIPEPKAVALWALGLVALAGAVSRRKAVVPA